MHLRLIKGLSYDGVVRASAAHPDVFVDDPEKYTALLESGYFEALPDAHTVTGHLDADFLGEMDEEQLVTAGITTVAALVAWWKNNSFTTAALEADKTYEKVKSQIR